MSLRLIQGLMLLSLVTACSHPLEIVGEGDIVSSDGSYGCTLEQQPCENYVIGQYDVTYTALPRVGSSFVTWDGCGAQHPDCSLNVPAAYVEQFWGQTAPPLRAVFQKELQSISSINFSKETANTQSSLSNQVDGLATDSSGNLYATGFECNNTLCRNSLAGKSSRVYIKKSSVDGELVWTTEITGILPSTEPGENNAYDLAIGNDEYIYINGSFQGKLQFVNSEGFPITVDSYLDSEGDPSLDSFVAKLNTSDGKVVWLKRYGGSASDGGNELEVDLNSNIVIIVTTDSDIIDFDGTPYNRNTSQDTPTLSPPDSFVVKLSPEGSILWIKHFDGYGAERIRAIETDGSGNVLAGVEFIGELQIDGISYNTTSALLSGGAFFRFASGNGAVTLSQPLFKTDIFGVEHLSNLQANIEYNVRGIYADNAENIFVCGVFSNEIDVGLSLNTNNALTLTSGDPSQLFLRADYLVAYNKHGKVLWADVIERSSGADGCEMDGNFENEFAIIGSYISSYSIKHYNAETGASAYRGSAQSGLVNKPLYYLFKYASNGDDPLPITFQDFSFQQTGGSVTAVVPSFQEGGTLHFNSTTGAISFSARLKRNNQASFGEYDESIIYKNNTTTEQGIIGILNF